MIKTKINKIGIKKKQSVQLKPGSFGKIDSQEDKIELLILIIN